jgi:predicted O-methyltransferase YrrM
MNETELLILGNQSKIEAEPVYPDPRFPPSLYYRFLRSLAQYTKPVVSVELGLCGGGASLYMALGNPDGLVIGIDITNEYPGNIEHVKEVCKHFEFWRMDSIDATEDYYNRIMPAVDILFIDTTHVYEQTMKEFNVWKPLLSPRCIICLDDLKRPGMDRTWADLPGYKLRMDWLHIGGEKTDGGFGVIYGL